MPGADSVVRFLPERVCNSRRKLLRITPPVDGIFLPFVHGDCTCNEIVGCVNRVCGAVPLPTVEGLRLLRAEARRVGRKLPRTDTISAEEFIEPYVGRRRERYLQAAATVARRGLVDSDSNVQAFVKSEKTDPSARENPHPRIIQCRKPTYNVELGRRLRRMEKALYQLPAGFSKTRSIAKGLNSEQRASLLKDKFGLFDDPVCYSLDCSRWDKHVAEAVLRIEHSLYLRMNDDPVLRELLEKQCKNKCYTKNGVCYVTRGKRNSGDMNTALGNCAMMVIMVRAAMRKLGIRKWEIIDDGDDCLLLVERRDEHLLSELPAIFLSFGQELKIENRATKIEDVVFCQCRYTDVGDRPRMIRPWRKVLSNGACGTAHWLERKHLPGLLNAVGLCEYALNRGVPILEEYALALIRLSNGAAVPKFFSLMDEGVGWRLSQELKTRDVSVLRDIKVSRSSIRTQDRMNFMRTWGLAPDVQVAYELQLRSWQLDTYAHREVEAEHIGGSPWFSNRSADQFYPEALPSL